MLRSSCRCQVYWPLRVCFEIVKFNPSKLEERLTSKVEQKGKYRAGCSGNMTFQLILSCATLRRSQATLVHTRDIGEIQGTSCCVILGYTRSGVLIIGGRLSWCFYAISNGVHSLMDVIERNPGTTCSDDLSVSLLRVYDKCFSHSPDLCRHFAQAPRTVASRKVCVHMFLVSGYRFPSQWQGSESKHRPLGYRPISYFLLILIIPASG